MSPEKIIVPERGARRELERKPRAAEQTRTGNIYKDEARTREELAAKLKAADDMDAPVILSAGETALLREIQEERVDRAAKKELERRLGIRKSGMEFAAPTEDTVALSVEEQEAAVAAARARRQARAPQPPVQPAPPRSSGVGGFFKRLLGGG